LKQEGLSLVNGGPTYRLMLRIGLVRPDAPCLLRRVLFFVLATWLPLLILSATLGLASGNRVVIPFLGDYLAYARFLIAIPLLILAEIVVDPVVSAAARSFVTSGVLDEADQPGYQSAAAELARLRDAALAEVVLLGLAYAVALAWLFGELSPRVSSWTALHSVSGATLTPAGWWYALVSVPMYQFLLYRWGWRILIWFQFLRRMSRLDLQLIPTHPDLAGGLGFLMPAHISFGSIVFPLGAVWAATLYRGMAYGGASLESLKIPAIAFAVLAVALCLGPLLVFTPRLLRTKLKGLREYGALATGYTRSFDTKWLRGKAPEGEEILGSGDIQSLADLGNSFERVHQMKVVPFGPRAVVGIAIAALAPMVPLLLTQMPLGELIKRLMSLLA
jgi:hypothetical protein